MELRSFDVGLLEIMGPRCASSGTRALEADHVVSMDIAGPVAVQTRKSIARHLANRAKKVSGARLSY
jgi:hypothetical protein